MEPSIFILLCSLGVCSVAFIFCVKAPSSKRENPIFYPVINRKESWTRNILAIAGGMYHRRV